MPFSHILNLSYEQTEQEVIFEDGVKYTIAETRRLIGSEPDLLKKVHTLKRIFGGRILPRQER
jgi:hypothetical protein